MAKFFRQFFPQRGLQTQSLELVSEPTPQLTDDRKEVKRFFDAFGARGAELFTEGKTFEEAMVTSYEELKAEKESLEKDLRAQIETLEKKLKAALGCEPTPLSSGGADEKRGGRTGAGLASKIRFALTSKDSPN